MKIDHTRLKAYTINGDITELCCECIRHNFRGVCVPPTYVKRAANLLNGTGKEISTVVGFPLGFHRSDTKLIEAHTAINEGATELDVVWDLGAFLNKEYLKVLEELTKIVRLYTIVKVIVEECYLETTDLGIAYDIVQDSGAWCIKTNTGYGASGANLATVEFWKTLGDLKIKAAGGIQTLSDYNKFIEAGADIIGTSAGVSIAKEQEGYLDTSELPG